MTLAEFEATFFACEVSDGHFIRKLGVSLADAHGVTLKCPACVRSTGHRLMVPFLGRCPPEHFGPKMARWSFTGTGLADLSIDPSYEVLGGCGWHGHIKNGSIA